MFVVRALQQVGETLPRLHELYDRLQANKVSGDDVTLAMVKRLRICVHVQLELEPLALDQVTEYCLTPNNLVQCYSPPQDTCWKNLRKPYHVISVIHGLLDMFASKPNSVPAYER